MDGGRFGELLLSLTAAPSRRAIARAVTSLALAGPLAALLSPGDSQGKKKRKKKKKCKRGKKTCGKKCILKTSCCKDADCGEGTCNGGTCICSAGFQSCLGTCIPEAACCVDGVKNREETDVDCGGGACPRCANGKTCESRDDCASAYCPLAVPRVCLACSANIDCGSDDDGTCACDTTVQGQNVCDKSLAEAPAARCEDCPAGTNCVRFPGNDFVTCFKPCGAP
jgi:hypothetical protein